MEALEEGRRHKALADEDQNRPLVDFSETSRLDFSMLSLASSSLSFCAPSTLARGGVAAGARARPVLANENEMEPDGGWGVDNLMDMMDTADEVRAHGTVHTAPWHHSHGTMHHTAPHHASCIVPPRAVSCCIVPAVPCLMDTADEVRAR